MTISNQSLKIPAHVAIIMDGNARWAKENSLPTSAGHKAGLEAIKTLIKSASDFGIKYLTIYAFSTENWQRPKEEVGYLMDMMKWYLKYEVNQLIENGVRIFISGNLENLDESTRNRIKEIEKSTAKNNLITLNVAFDYGARQEIVDALKKIVLAIENKKITFADINENLISNNLYHPEIPDPDLLIRTAGEFRVSNFLLWQVAYTEFYFTEKFWPDFDKQDLQNAILSFNQRERRYGKRK
jgi:undecaprenyl diphosphate synthase